jgi:hypothetical protein
VPRARSTVRRKPSRAADGCCRPCRPCPTEGRRAPHGAARRPSPSNSRASAGQDQHDVPLGRDGCSARTRFGVAKSGRRPPLTDLDGQRRTSAVPLDANTASRRRRRGTGLGHRAASRWRAPPVASSPRGRRRCAAEAAAPAGRASAAVIVGRLGRQQQREQGRSGPTAAGPPAAPRRAGRRRWAGRWARGSFGRTGTDEARGRRSRHVAQGRRAAAARGRGGAVESASSSGVARPERRVRSGRAELLRPWPRVARRLADDRDGEDRRDDGQREGRRDVDDVDLSSILTPTHISTSASPSLR